LQYYVTIWNNMKKLYKKIKNNLTFFRKSVSSRDLTSQGLSKKKAEEATRYVGERFGRALVRLSDR